MKFGCICGWIGLSDERGKHDGAFVCPRCLKRATIRPVYLIVKCHWCNTPKHVQLIGKRLYRCHQCDRIFDNEPDEGGDFGNDPSRRMQREEGRRARL